jgi:APA family basic amino acid/polyamine antiporter
MRRRRASGRRWSTMAADPRAPSPELDRRLGTGDAVVVGLGSMMGAGVFAVWAPAARAAGVGVLLGLVLAAGVAYCNAVASAQLAAVYPVSGGTYVYGRERLGEWWGFAAGWAFIVGKTASCAAMALTFASYAVDGPRSVQRLAAVAVVVAMAGLNYRGVTRTAFLTRVLVTCTLLALGVFIVAAVTSSAATADNLSGWSDVSARGVLQAAGLLFFAFAGYARIATMGEEVRDPRTTIPRAIPLALALAIIAYVVVGLAALAVAGPRLIAGSSSPLATALDVAGRGSLAPVVQVGAALASLGALLALIAGIGRTTLAMARAADLPTWLAAVHPRYRVPHRAEVVLAMVVSLLVLTLDLRGALGFSSFGVLLYYAIANASAFTQPPQDRRWPRALQVIGVVGCLVLAFSLPAASVATGLVVLGVGLLGRAVSRRRHTA